MRKKISSNRGLSLLEILVSLTIASIMIFPITSMVNTAIKTSKRSEERQQATLLGQEIVEEIRVKDKISSDNLNLTGGTLQGSQVDNKFIYENNRYKYGKSEYIVNIAFEKNNSIDYDGLVEREDTLVSDKFILSSENESSFTPNIKIAKPDSQSMTIPIDKENATINIELKNGSNSKALIISNEISSQKYRISDSKVILNFTKNYSLENGVTIKTINSTDSPFDIYIQKSYGCYEKIYVEKVSGETNIDYIREPEESEESKISDLYNITVEVKKEDKSLFSSSINKNIDVIDE